MNHRELLGDLARLAYETIQELMAAAVGDPRARPGVVAVPQTFGSALKPHPHLHCLASRAVWNDRAEWLPVPYVDTQAAEKLFSLKVIHFLKNKGLVNEERIELLTSFRRSGFSVDTSVTIWPDDKVGLDRLACYLLRCPVSLSCIHWTPGDLREIKDAFRVGQRGRDRFARVVDPSERERRVEHRLALEPAAHFRGEGPPWLPRLPREWVMGAPR